MCIILSFLTSLISWNCYFRVNLLFSLNKKEKLLYTRFFLQWMSERWWFSSWMLRFYGFEPLRKTNCSLLTISVARFLYLKVIECFQQVKHVISRQWLDFSHWWMCLFREVVNNSLVRYWRASTFNFFFDFQIFRGKGWGCIFLGVWRTIHLSFFAVIFSMSRARLYLTNKHNAVR